MVMVSITFAVLNRGLQAHLRPAGFPHAHTRISNILGHGYKLMAISLGLCLWRFVLCRGQGPGHGAGRGHARRRTGNGLKPKAMAMGKTIMASSPRQSHQALSHGNRFRPWLEAMAMARASSVWPEKREYGYLV